MRKAMTVISTAIATYGSSEAALTSRVGELDEIRGWTERVLRSLPMKLSSSDISCLFKSKSFAKWLAPVQLLCKERSTYYTTFCHNLFNSCKYLALGCGPSTMKALKLKIFMSKPKSGSSLQFHLLHDSGCGGAKVRLGWYERVGRSDVTAENHVQLSTCSRQRWPNLP